MTNRHNPRAILSGLAALIALALVVLGLPVLLLAVAGSPLPDQLPTVDGIQQALTQQDDGTAALVILQCVAWGCWAWFTGTVLIDIAQRARGRAPLRGTSAASRLVGAVLAVAVAAPAAAMAAEPGPPTLAVESTATAAGLRQAVAVGDGTVVVEPGDTLWDIAQDELGDPYRWPEIAAANDEALQPDGRRLTDPDLIRPGWSLALPGDTSPASAQPNPSIDPPLAIPEPPPSPSPSAELPEEEVPQVVTPFRSEAQPAPPAVADQTQESESDVVTPLQAAEQNWRAAGAAYKDSREPGSDWRAALEAPFTGGL